MKLVCNPFLLNLLLLVWGISSIFLCYIFEFWGLKPIFSMPIILYTYCIWNGAWMLSNVGHWGTVGFLDVFSLSVVKLHCSSWEVKKCSEEKLRHDENIFIFCFMLFFLFFMSYESCLPQLAWKKRLCCCCCCCCDKLIVNYVLWIYILGCQRNFF